MVGEEEQAGQRVGVHVAFKPHPGSPLDVKDYVVTVVSGGSYSFGACLPGQREKVPVVELIEPGQSASYPPARHAAARYVRHLVRFTGQGRRARVRPEVGDGGDVKRDDLSMWSG